jgi:TolB-like protein
MSRRINVIKKCLRQFGLALPMTLAIAGCATDSGSEATSSVTIGASAYAIGDLSTLAYRAVDLILAAAPEVTGSTPIVVSSITDTQAINRGSAFGNILSDMIRTRLVQDGHTASEIRLRNTVSFHGDEGEFLLSRNRRALMRAPYAAAVVTGTYAASFDRVYVSIKLVSANDTHIISAADFVVPIEGLAGLMSQYNSHS